jgi:hypothetical protein
MSVDWTEADMSVIHTAETLIEKYHPDLKRARIGFIFRSEPSVSGDKFVVGHTKKVSYQDQTLLDYDFIIWLAKDIYEKWEQKRREALIDHELCHCTKTETGEAKIRHHDIEEFEAIIDRYGLWDKALASVAPAFERALQLDLGLRSLPQPELVGSVTAVSPDLVPFD